MIMQRRDSMQELQEAADRDWRSRHQRRQRWHRRGLWAAGWGADLLRVAIRLAACAGLAWLLLRGLGVL